MRDALYLAFVAPFLQKQSTRRFTGLKVNGASSANQIRTWSRTTGLEGPSCRGQQALPFQMTTAPETSKVSTRSVPGWTVSGSTDDVIELLVPEAMRPELEAEARTLPRVVLTEETDLQWLHVLSEGWASPLRGYMREEEYLQCLHFNCLRSTSGTLYNQSVAIVLTVDDAQRQAIEASGRNAICITWHERPEEPLAILRNPEFYVHNKEERCARQLGTTHPKHPYAEVIYRSGNWLVGGDLQVLKRIKYNDGLDAYRLTPKELRREFHKRGTDAVFVFQLRNPIHNGHALLMTSCREDLLRRGYRNPILLVHQIGGRVKADDVPLRERILQNQEVIAEGILDPESTMLGIFPSPMMYAGPTEVQWHAKARMNAGCQFYIVGRDPAGVKHPDGDRDLYDPWHGKKVLLSALGLERLEILPFRVAAYDKKIGKMAFFDPSRADDFLFISGTKMRAFAARGESPPDGFMGVRAWKVLENYYAQKREAQGSS
jgi:3'-phosphoadenosine 5'-phosphosulfate synthase